MDTRIATCLWFDGRIDEAAEFYVSLIPGSRIVARSAYPEGSGVPGGADMTGQALVIDLELDGVPFQLLNGGPQFPLSEAVSISVRVDDQAELDRLWDALIADGGEESQCGWCKDRFGLSWQIVPRQMEALMQTEHAAAVTQAMMGMRKLDIAALEAAAR